MSASGREPKGGQGYVTPITSVLRAASTTSSVMAFMPLIRRMRSIWTNRRCSSRKIAPGHAHDRGDRLAVRLRRCQDDHRTPRPAHPPLRHRGNRQRELALPQSRSRLSHTSEARPHRHGGERATRAHNAGGKIARRYGVNFPGRLTFRGQNAPACG